MEDITAWNVSLKAMRFKNTLCYSHLLWIFFACYPVHDVPTDTHQLQKSLI